MFDPYGIVPTANRLLLDRKNRSFVQKRIGSGSRPENDDERSTMGGRTDVRNEGIRSARSFGK